LLPLFLLAVSLCAQTFELLPEERAELGGAPVTEAFLKQRSQRLVEEWRVKDKDASLTAEDRRQALLIYWYRGPLLSDEDRAFLKSLNPLEPGQPPASKNLTSRPPADKALAELTAPLLASLKAQLVILDHGNSEHAKQLELAFARMLESPLARELAEEFVRLGGRARISFEKMPDGVIFEENGVRRLVGAGGSTNSSGQVPVIRLNEDYLKMPPEYIDMNLPGTLGHELFGHALEDIKAKKAGVADAFDHFELNETNAGLVGWIIEAERGHFDPDTQRDIFLASPDEYHERLKMLDAYYAATFDLSDIQNPVPVLKARAVKAEKALAAYKADPIAMHAALRPVADHFTDIHSVLKVVLKRVYERIDRVVGVTGPRQVAEYERIIAHAKRLMAYYASEGSGELARIKRQAVHPLFTRVAEQVEKRRERLTALMAEKPVPAQELPSLMVIAPRPGPPKEEALSSASQEGELEWTWSGFLERYSQDKAENPEHYKPREKKP
jgi:hypothetical protein